MAELLKLNEFHVASPEEYDSELCLIPKALVWFLQITQPKVWEELRMTLGDEEEERRDLKRKRQ